MWLTDCVLRSIVIAELVQQEKVVTMHAVITSFSEKKKRKIRERKKKEAEDNGAPPERPKATVGSWRLGAQEAGTRRIRFRCRDAFAALGEQNNVFDRPLGVVESLANPMWCPPVLVKAGPSL